MAADETTHDRLEEMLRGANLDVESVGETWNVSRGSGAMEAKANVDPVPFLESLSADASAARRRMAGWVSGVKHVLLEPGNSEADTWNFTEAAGRLGMAIEVDSFVDGVEAAAGSAAWTQPFDEDLVYVFLLELDMGIRVLTADQFDAWSATPDRVVSGARSMLFHKAESTSPEKLEAYPGVERFHVGDGYDAARALVLDDLMFGEFGDSTRIAIPTTDDLLFVREGTDENVEALNRAARNRCQEADYPLTTTLYRFERGQPVPCAA